MGDDGSLRGRVFLIAGANTGVGRATATDWRGGAATS